MSTAIVAGGGIAGLLAAKLLARRGRRVVLIEQSATCGGLLGSIVDERGVSFDHGAHILSDTGVPALDEVLFGRLDPRVWREFRVLRSGNWFGGAFNRLSQFPDARLLGPELRLQILNELKDVAVRQHDSPPRHLGETIERKFGATLAAHVVARAIKKQTRLAPESLHPATPFVVRRVICADAEESRELKLDPRFSEVLAFNSFDEGVGTLRHRYPFAGGIGKWAGDFVEELVRDGVEVLNGRTIGRVTVQDQRATSVMLDDGRHIACDLLAWTIPASALLKAASLPFESTPMAPRPNGLFHLEFDRPFSADNYYVTCYDETPRLFRITLYPNLRGDGGSPPYNCTVEVVGENTTGFADLVPEIVEGLRRMGVVSADAQLVSSHLQVVPVGFPATTHAFMTGSAAQAALVTQHVGNALLLGRARCPPFFMTDVLVDVFRKIEERV